uniref:Uncharacterized protein n=1 Tax=Plectus sambesii TaxID=2011161 RepID=A0A914XAJ0_9BILA
MSLASVWIAFVFLILFACHPSSGQRISRIHSIKEGPAQKLKESKSAQFLLPVREKLGYFPPECSRISPNSDQDLLISCHGGQFQQSSGLRQPCRTHADCYNSREPYEWCPLEEDYLWTDWGCHCDPKIGSCIIERHFKTLSSLEWTFCTPTREFRCRSPINDP